MFASENTICSRVENDSILDKQFQNEVYSNTFILCNFLLLNIFKQRKDKNVYDEKIVIYRIVSWTTFHGYPNEKS